METVTCVACGFQTEKLVEHHWFEIGNATRHNKVVCYSCNTALRTPIGYKNHFMPSWDIQVQIAYQNRRRRYRSTKEAIWMERDSVLKDNFAKSPPSTQRVWVEMLGIMNESYYHNGRFEFQDHTPYKLEFIAIVCHSTYNELMDCLKEYETITNRYNNHLTYFDNETLVLNNWQDYLNERNQAIEAKKQERIHYERAFQQWYKESMQRRLERQQRTR